MLVIHTLVNCIFLVLIKRSYKLLNIKKYYSILLILYISYLIIDIYTIT